MGAMKSGMNTLRFPHFLCRLATSKGPAFVAAETDAWDGKAANRKGRKRGKLCCQVERYVKSSHIPCSGLLTAPLWRLQLTGDSLTSDVWRALACFPSTPSEHLCFRSIQLSRLLDNWKDSSFGSRHVRCVSCSGNSTVVVTKCLYACTVPVKSFNSFSHLKRFQTFDW